MFEALDILPLTELETRWTRCRKLMAETVPDAGGLLVCSRLHVYYFTGTFCAGLFWLPLDGEPVLMVRKGLERAVLESRVARIASFKSFKEFPGLLNEYGVPFSEVVAAETAGLSWQMGKMLEERIRGVRFVPGDLAIMRTRSVKSELELETMRRCGALHHKALHEILPGRLHPGLTEREIAHMAWEVFFSLGHTGLIRMNAFGEEIFLGHVSAGDSGNYPSTFNGPLGLRGEHPASPHMGSASRYWNPGEPLAADVGFALNGYQTDKTQVYWGGGRESIPEEIRAAQDFCMDVQSWLAENLRPGAIPSELNAHCFAWAEREGFAEGFMGLGGNKVPFVGHGIGLTIDGYPVLARGFDLPLEEGMTLALEPKQGIPGVGMVGVENTFEVTAGGGRSLTGDEHDIVCVGA